MKRERHRSTLLKQRVHSLTRVLDDVEKGDERALHRARVASRRLRELVPILQLDPTDARKIGGRLRKVTRRLGRVRELDVLLLLIDELHVSRPMHRDSLRRVRQLVAHARDQARGELAEGGVIDSARKLVRRLNRVLDDLSTSDTAAGLVKPTPGRTASWVIDARIAHRAQRLAAAIDNATALYLPDRLHDVRVAVKKLRYAVELGGEGSAERAKAVKTLKRLQDLLGRMHDLQVLIDWVRNSQASISPPNLIVWRDMDALVVALDESCRRLHARYVRERDSVRAVRGKLSAPVQAAARRSERRAG
jgi:CHAD domain-containing protein